MTRTWRPLAATLALAVVAAGVAGCDRGSDAPIPTTASGKRICGMLSDADVRTVAGADPSVRSTHINPEPGTGYLLNAVCEVDAGDVYLKINVNWRPTATDRSQVRADLSRPPEGNTRTFPADQGVGFVTTENSPQKNAEAALLRGQYKVTLELSGAPGSRDRLADAQAFLLQAVQALALPVADTAERPKAAY